MTTLDVRKIPHPERPPLVIQKLEEEGELDLIVEVNPVPLIQMLTQKGYSCKSIKEGDHWKVEIRR